MNKHIRRGVFVRAAAFVVMAAAFAASAWAQQAAVLDKPGDLKKIYQEIAGDYEFEFEGQPMTVNFFEKDGRLYGAPAGETPEELLPVEGSPLKFTVMPEGSGQTYELEFVRNDKKVIDRCTLKVQGMEVLGMKITKK